MGRGRCASVLLKCMGMYPANQGVLWGLLPWPLDIRLSYSRTAWHHTQSSRQNILTHAPIHVFQQLPVSQLHCTIMSCGSIKSLSFITQLSLGTSRQGIFPTY